MPIPPGSIQRHGPRSTSAAWHYAQRLSSSVTRAVMTLSPQSWCACCWDDLARFSTTGVETRCGSGVHWVEEVFTRLEASAVGIPLFSPNYLESGICLHEARDMVVHRDHGKMRIVPVKISDVELPAFCKNDRVINLAECNDLEEVIDRIVQVLDDEPDAGRLHSNTAGNEHSSD